MKKLLLEFSTLIQLIIKNNPNIKINQKLLKIYEIKYKNNFFNIFQY